MPARHGAWFAEQVIQVKLKYGLSIDPAERDALEALTADQLTLTIEDNDVTPVPVPVLPLLWQLLLGLGLLGSGARQLYRRQHVPPMRPHRGLATGWGPPPARYGSEGD